MGLSIVYGLFPCMTYPQIPVVEFICYTELRIVRVVEESVRLGYL